MNSHRHIRHCSFCGDSDHNIVNCHNNRLTDFEFVCASEVQTTDTPGIFKDWLARTYSNNPMLIQAFAIRKSRPGNYQRFNRITLRSSFADCLDVIANYIFMCYKDVIPPTRFNQLVQDAPDTITQYDFTENGFDALMNDPIFEIDLPLTLEDLDVPAVAELPNVIDFPQPALEYDPMVIYDPNLLTETEALLIAELIIRNPNIINRVPNSSAVIAVVEAYLLNMIDILVNIREQIRPLVNLRVETSDNEQMDEIRKCCICWDEKELVNFVSLDCRHEFCKDCIIATTVHNQGVVPCCALCRGVVGSIVSRNVFVQSELANAVR